MTGYLSPYRSRRDVLESLIEKMERSKHAPTHLRADEIEAVRALAEKELEEMDSDWAEAIG